MKSKEGSAKSVTDLLNEDGVGKLKLVPKLHTTAFGRLTPEPEAAELRELIRTLQNRRQPKDIEQQEDDLPPQHDAT